MRFLTSVPILAIAGSLLAMPVNSQSLETADSPANLPPTTFEGTQFVDNSGCIFVRAGLGGNTAWVPRVASDRTQMCGLTPTFGAALPAQEAAVDPAPRPAAKPVAQPVVPKAKPVASRVTAPVIKRKVTVPKIPSVKRPKGYKAAWSDGRLNSQRGPRTAAGNAQMSTLWTDTVPRKLISTK